MRLRGSAVSRHPKLISNILIKRARIEGFIVIDYMSRAMEAMADLGRWLAEGKIKYRVNIVEGLDHAPEALGKLSNMGKLVVQL